MLDFLKSFAHSSNRQHSINVQAVCDADRVFTNVVARWPGSTHDATIFANLALHEDCIEGRLGNSWLIGKRWGRNSTYLKWWPPDMTFCFHFPGDSGYPLRPFLLTPFMGDGLMEPQEAFNRAHKTTRVIIKRAFRELKARWRCLNKQGTVKSNRSDGIAQQSTNKIICSHGRWCTVLWTREVLQHHN